MAPWIKMRTDLRRHPKVVRMASALSADRYRVIGGLLAVWAVFDEQTEDGFLEGYTPQAMDDEIGWPGFSAAMMGVAWLSFQEQAGLAMPEFEEHNGQSAKRRASETKRKQQERQSENGPQDVGEVSASRADKKRTRGRGREDSSSLRSEEGRATRAKPPRSRKTPLPENFAVSDRVKAWAKEKGFGRLDEHLDAFLRKVKANGYTYIDWDAAFMEAIREDWAKLRGRAPNGAAPPSDGAEGEWHETRAGVEKRAAEMEMPKWDELVPYPTYKARVMSEHERRAH